MKKILFRAKTKEWTSYKGGTIQGLNVIQGKDRLLISNKASAGFWVECEPNSLEILHPKTRNTSHD